MPGKGKPFKSVRLDRRLLEYLQADAKQRGITVSALIRALLEAYVRRKSGCDTPSFFMSEKTLERVFHVRFLQAVNRLHFIIAGSGLDVPALRAEKLQEICDILDKLNALAAKTKDPMQRLQVHDRIARFYRIFDMMANNVEYDEIKRAVDELRAEEVARMGETQEASDGTQAKQS